MPKRLFMGGSGGDMERLRDGGPWYAFVGILGTELGIDPERLTREASASSLGVDWLDVAAALERVEETFMVAISGLVACADDSFGEIFGRFTEKIA